MWRNGCTNIATFRREEIEQYLVAALCAKLNDPALLKSLAQSVFQYLKSEKAKRKHDGETEGFRRNQLESALQAEEKRRDNLVQAIAAGGEIRSLVDALVASESEIKHLATKLSGIAPSTRSKITTLADVRKFVESHAKSFEGILFGAAETLKVELQRRISPALTVTPVDTGKGRAFLVSGGVGLFSPGEGAMLSDRVTLIGQHCTIPVNITIPLLMPQKRRQSVRKLKSISGSSQQRRNKPRLDAHKQTGYAKRSHSRARARGS